MFPIKKILAPIDFERPVSDSLEHARILAAQLGASLCIAHVYSIPVYSFPDGVLIASPDLATRLSETAQRHLDATVDAQKGRGVEITSVLAEGNPTEEIAKIAEREKADLIVMGTHGRRGVTRALLGSVAEKVLRTSTVPVLVIHTPREGAHAPDEVSKGRGSGA